MSGEKRYRARDEVSLGDEGDEGAILFNADTGNVMVLNPTGRTVWQFLAEPRTTAEIGAHLAERFDGVGEARAARDVAVFLERLLPEYVEEIAPHDDP